MTESLASGALSRQKKSYNNHLALAAGSLIDGGARLLTAKDITVAGNGHIPLTRQTVEINRKRLGAVKSQLEKHSSAFRYVLVISEALKEFQAITWGFDEREARVAAMKKIIPLIGKEGADAIYVTADPHDDLLNLALEIEREKVHQLALHHRSRAKGTDAQVEDQSKPRLS